VLEVAAHFALTDSPAYNSRPGLYPEIVLTETVQAAPARPVSHAGTRKPSRLNTVKDSPRERLRTLDQAVQECEKLEAELTKLRATNASQPGIDNQILVRASAPVTRVRQIANWCNGTPHKDQQEELKALQQLPAKWLASLRSLIQQESNADSSHS
jgi:hypothetical protein